MTQQEYEQKKRECWEEFCESDKPYDVEPAFAFAFDRAYALGKEKEAVTQEEIEKAAEKFADEIKIPPSAHGVMVPFINGLAHDAYLQGARDFLGKQEKDTDTVIQGWVARDGNNDLNLYFQKPIRNRYSPYWAGLGIGINFSKESFPDLTWESDSEPVEIIIKRKKK